MFFILSPLNLTNMYHRIIYTYKSIIQLQYWTYEHYLGGHHIQIKRIFINRFWQVQLHFEIFQDPYNQWRKEEKNRGSKLVNPLLNSFWKSRGEETVSLFEKFRLNKLSCILFYIFSTVLRLHLIMLKYNLLINVNIKHS